MKDEHDIVRWLRRINAFLDITFCVIIACIIGAYAFLIVLLIIAAITRMYGQ